jgi:transcriptional regulator of acetoin/glycerol metabolism
MWQRKWVMTMTPTSLDDAARPEGVELAESRVRFLTADATKPARVRPAILASWRRSRDLKVAADKVSMPYIRDPDIDTPLTRSAEPVLSRLREQLDGQPVSIVVTDPSGLVLSRRTADADLERHLDHVRLAPGFSYAEQFVGTNGIGTALEAGAATHVFGHEHYAENLEDLACAGVPLRHPISGRTVGAVDLTCWRKDAGSLLLTLAKTTAEQIQQAMLADSAPHELELLQAYRRTCHRMTGIVFAMTDDAVMLNDHARNLLDPIDQAALFAEASQTAYTLPAGRRRSIGITLPTGTQARMHCEQVHAGSRVAGIVVHVKLGEKPADADHNHGNTAQHGSFMPLPGLVGRAPLWLRASQEIETAVRAGEWLVVQGEPGVGKLAALRAAHLRCRPVGRFAVVDCALAGTEPRWPANTRRTLLEHDSVIIRHIDTLDGRQLRAVSSALQDANTQSRERPLWAAVTLGNARSDRLDPLLRLFPSTVEVPPLRLHLEDLEQLVAFFLARLGHGGNVSCSPTTMRLLMRSSWPGNVTQVHELLHHVVQHRRVGLIEPSDLPPGALTVSRRRLSPLESLERDAIVNSLADAAGNKVKAARSLGMSRATIYRKIHEYGIVDPAG